MTMYGTSRPSTLINDTRWVRHFSKYRKEEEDRLCRIRVLRVMVSFILNTFVRNLRTHGILAGLDCCSGKVSQHNKFVFPYGKCSLKFCRPVSKSGPRWGLTRDPIREFWAWTSEKQLDVSAFVEGSRRTQRADLYHSLSNTERGARWAKGMLDPFVL